MLSSGDDGAEGQRPGEIEEEDDALASEGEVESVAAAEGEIEFGAAAGVEVEEGVGDGFPQEFPKEGTDAGGDGDVHAGLRRDEGVAYGQGRRLAAADTDGWEGAVLWDDRAAEVGAESEEEVAAADDDEREACDDGDVE